MRSTGAVRLGIEELLILASPPAESLSSVLEQDTSAGLTQQDLSQHD